MKKLEENSLIEKGLEYLNSEGKESVKSILLTEDGSMFNDNPAGQGYARSHRAKIGGTKIVKVTRATKPKEEAPESEEDKKKPLNKMTNDELLVEVESLEGWTEEAKEAFLNLPNKPEKVKFIQEWPGSFTPEEKKEEGKEEDKGEEGKGEGEVDIDSMKEDELINYIKENKLSDLSKAKLKKLKMDELKEIAKKPAENAD